MSNRRKSPDFFILGAPKCGTTALARYLSEHPEICMSRPKEPNFFCSDLKVFRVDAETVRQYEAHCFAHVDPITHRVLGEASVWNLYSKLAVPRILSEYPAAKFIVMLRNPVDMAHSLHSQSVFQGQEDQQRFISAWRLCEKRRRGESLPKGHGKMLPEIRYDEVCRLGEQVHRMLQLVPREQVLFLFADDLQSRTTRVYRDVLSFLGVTKIRRIDFPKVNEARRFRSPLLAYALRTRFAWKFAALIKRITGLKTLGIGKPMPPLTAEGRYEVGACLAQDVELLSNLTGRDLQHWLRQNNSAVRTSGG